MINVIGILNLARDRTENQYPLFLITRLLASTGGTPYVRHMTNRNLISHGDA